MYNHPALRGMETFRKGIKTVASGTILTGLDVAGVTRLKRPQDAGYRPAEVRVEWASPGMLFRHGFLRTAWVRIPLPGMAPFPQGMHPSHREYTFPVGNTRRCICYACFAETNTPFP